MQWTRWFPLFLVASCLAAFCLAGYADREIADPETGEGIEGAEALQDEELPEIDEFFRQHGVGEDYSPESLENLRQLIADKLALIADDLSAIKDALDSGSEDEARLKKRRKDLKERRSFLRHAAEQIERALEAGTSERAKISAFYLGKRVVYVVETLELEDESTDYIARLEETFETVGNAMTVLKRHLLKNSQFKVPYLAAGDLDQPIGAQQARKEARFLVDPADPQAFASVDALARLTPRAVAALDVSDEHPVWHTKAYLEEHPDGWGDLERWLEQRLTEKLDKDHDLADQYPDFSYDISRARQVLFFDKVKDSASSPKIRATDAFDVDWKIKWGDEVQTEVVNNRLWMKLGGKFNDLVYANGPGREHLVLVLADPAQAVEDGDEEDCHPLTYEDLARCLAESRYRFHLDPYRHESGLLGPDNVDSVLAHLPREALSGYRKEDLLGRHFVTFRESLVEIKPPRSVVLRGGAASFSGVGARRDRVGRGLLLFNMWLWNRDAKDDNNRGLLLKDSGGRGPTYVETQHDLGASLGGLISAGEINYLEVGDAFARTGRTGSGWFDWLRSPTHIFFRQFVIYYPEAWREPTWADARWMGEKLAALSREDIEEIVAHTLWPDFMQQALTYKLLARRNQIASLLHIDVAGDADLPLLDLRVSLATEEDRRRAAGRFGIDASSIAQAMQNAGLMDRSFVDRLVERGQVRECEDTVLIGILERELHPSGLEERVSRLVDNRTGDRGCEYDP